jgi:hypothetical protein
MSRTTGRSHNGVLGAFCARFGSAVGSTSVGFFGSTAEAVRGAMLTRLTVMAAGSSMLAVWPTGYGEGIPAARVVEKADTAALKAAAERRAGSIPALGTALSPDHRRSRYPGSIT